MFSCLSGILPCRSLDPWLVVFCCHDGALRVSASLVQLSSIVPLLEQAKQAVGSIDNAALAEVRAMQAPPEAVHDVLSAVLQVSALFPESHLGRVGRPWEYSHPISCLGTVAFAPLQRTKGAALALLSAKVVSLSPTVCSPSCFLAPRGYAALLGRYWGSATRLGTA